MKRVGLGYDEDMLLHRAPKGDSHPEKPKRILSIYEALQKQSFFNACKRVDSVLATNDDILLVHSQEHLNMFSTITQLLATNKTESIYFGLDTFANTYTPRAALLSAGILLEMTRKVVSNELDNGFAIIRPPGHHAEREKMMGFCLLNNVAMAAQYARVKLGVGKVLIVDWDVHHGNGTQNIFEEDENVLYMSTHRYDNGKFYPGTGSVEDVGTGKGKGFSVNVPWNGAAHGDTEYIECFRDILLPIAKEFQPELVFVSCGFDCAAGDPLGSMRVSPKGFRKLTDMLLELANGKVIMALEGGYNVDSISKSAVECVKGLLGCENEEDDNNNNVTAEPMMIATISPSRDVVPRAEKVLTAVVEEQSKYWKCMEQEKTRKMMEKLALDKPSDTPTIVPVATANNANNNVPNNPTSNSKDEYVRRVVKDFGISKESAEQLWYQFRRD